MQSFVDNAGDNIRRLKKSESSAKDSTKKPSSNQVKPATKAEGDTPSVSRKSSVGDTEGLPEVQ